MLPESITLCPWEGAWGLYDISAEHPLDVVWHRNQECWFETEQQAREFLADHGYVEPLATTLPNYFERSTPVYPEYVQVAHVGTDLYNIVPDGNAPFQTLLFAGNAEQTHTWLGQHDYKRTRFAPGSWLAGQFRRQESRSAA